MLNPQMGEHNEIPSDRVEKDGVELPIWKCGRQR